MPPVRTSVTKRASRKRRETIGTPSRGRGHRCRQSTRPRTNLSPTRRAPAEATGADGIPALPLPSDTIQPTLTPQIEQSIPGIPSGSGFSTQCKIRQCSQCNRDAGFFCTECKHDFCSQCKENHAIHVDSISHYVVIYREKYKHFFKQEKCKRHPQEFYKTYCHSCQLPVCDQCILHRKHQILDIRIAYETSRQQHREIIQNIRSKNLSASLFILKEIKANITLCHTEIANCRTKMSTKTQKVMNHICTFEYAKSKFKIALDSLQEQKRQMNNYIAFIEKVEHKIEHLRKRSRPVIFLLFLKKTTLPYVKNFNDSGIFDVKTSNKHDWIHRSKELIRKIYRFFARKDVDEKKIFVPMMKNTPHITHQSLRFLTEEIKMEDVKMLMCELTITISKNRKLNNEIVRTAISSPRLYTHFRVTDIESVNHISFVKPDRVWISGKSNFILINTKGEKLNYLPDKGAVWGGHTVNITGDLIYIDRKLNICKQSKDNKTKSTLVQFTKPWEPRCVFCSLINANLLVGMCYTVVHTYAKVTRYNEFGHLIQTIQNTTEGQKLYCKPFYITENRNEDIIVSDLHLNAVVVTDREGRHRFSYKGHPSGFEPGNICTDELSHILVCDCWTRTVQMLDKDGGFLTLIPIDQKGIKIPESVVYDSKSHLLWVGIKNSNEVFVYRYYIRGQQANLEEGCDKQENPKDNNISTWWSEEEYI